MADSPFETGRYWTEPWGVVHGCSPVNGTGPEGSPCRECWARAFAGRFPKVHGDFRKVRFHSGRLAAPEHWRDPRVIFPDMGDLFHRRIQSGAIGQVYDVATRNPRHQYLFLTKRPERLWELAQLAPMLVLANWIKTGVTMWDQASVDRDLPLLKEVRGERWISLEPLLAPVTKLDLIGISWVVVGAESGAGRRLCDLRWIAKVVELCREDNCPVWVKQVSLDGRISRDMREWPHELRVRQAPTELARILGAA